MHVPDTANGGFLNFNRFYFAQTDKQAAVIDERYNHGGAIADYIIDLLRTAAAKLRHYSRGRKMVFASRANLRPENNGHQ